MRKKIKFVIEHLEQLLSKWILIEYKHSSQIVGKENVVFTNVRRSDWRKILLRIGEVYEESITSRRIHSMFDKIIILDPQAKILLSPKDFMYCGSIAIVIGGILGDNPPKGRTRKLLTEKMDNIAEIRNLGGNQFSIDGAVFMAYQILNGREITEIPIIVGWEEKRIMMGIEHSVFLPYAYPLVEGRPLISKELLEYLMSGEIVFDEEESKGGLIEE